ncbi:MAG: extracellular solute-binding protein [Anaerolineae bacterium]
MMKKYILAWLLLSSLTLSFALPVHAAPPGQEQIILTLWWWGEQEAPGAQNWLEETIALYEEAHPGVKIEHVLQTTSGLMPAFQAAAEAKKGPDIQYLWGGIWTLEHAWKGDIVPISDYWPQEEIDHLISNEERTYNGKLWGVSWYLSGNAMAYNKALFQKAGLNPENPPETWEDFLATCQALKDSGIIPLAGGLRDGWFGSWLWQMLGKQALDSPEELKRAIAGETHFTDPELAACWEKLQELRDKGYWNENIISLDYWQGQEIFVQGRAAMIFANDTFFPGWIELMEENLGVMKIPIWGTGKLASGYVVAAQGFSITSWSPHKKEAADFLLFMHKEDRLRSWYEHTGLLPADDRFDPAAIKIPQMRQVFEWILENPAPNLENFIPPVLDEQANFVGCQKLFAGEMDAEGAATLQEEVISRWREQNPEALANFKAWEGALVAAAPTPASEEVAEPSEEAVKEEKIAFAVFDLKRDTYDIYIANPDGSGREKLIEDASQPALSPDGKEIVYRSWASDERGLIAQSLTGENPWRFTVYSEASRPAWASKKQFFLFHSRQEADRSSRIYRTEGANIHTITRPDLDNKDAFGEMPAFISDGRFVYKGCEFAKCGLIALNIDGTGAQILVEDKDATAPATSPDGTKIAYMSYKDRNWEIYIVNVEGGSATRLTENEARDGIPTWSPDGKLIAFASDRDESWAIWVMNPDGTGQRKLFDLGGSLDGRPHGAPEYEAQGWLGERISWVRVE